jgi:starch synthase (maltosyl-transferring)
MSRERSAEAIRIPAAMPSRVVVENVRPAVDGGRFPVKRTVGEKVVVTADAHADGHDVLFAVLQHRRKSQAEWSEEEMEPLGNDAWRAAFTVTALEPHFYRVEAWVDRFATWQRDLRKRLEAEAQQPIDLQIGAEIVAAAAARATGLDAARLEDWAAELREWAGKAPVEAYDRALDDELAGLMRRHADRRLAGHSPVTLELNVDRKRARFSAWYETFPRSCADSAEGHGTFADCERRLPYVKSMGFDVLYLPPIHPIGRFHRKGPNNAPVAGPADHGSPWAIGSAEGDHKAIHPQLGTIEDFRRLVKRADEHGIELALDLAFQCAPDHPYVREHPQWFRARPDGTIQYAENPPKKYQDIYPIDFETEDWRALWLELKGVVDYWVAQGVRIFRVDNPHTKPYRFWEWLIAEVRLEHPDVIFLAEAFTRPKVMYQLAKLGFSQSYTYFAWRNTSFELRDYFTELTKSDVREYFRPNAWPNTPDILTEQLQYGGRNAFVIRLVLAATLCASYGIYGPAYELCEARPRSPGSEEYLDSEKYEIRRWELARADSLKELIGRVNRIRRENKALQSDESLRFHEVDNEQLIAYSKHTEDQANVILAVVNLDPHHTQSGWVRFPLEEHGLDPHAPYQLHDLLTDARYFWSGPRNFVHLEPSAPAHVFRLRRKLRSERDFDYFL